jgi:hypothetical protein
MAFGEKGAEPGGGLRGGVGRGNADRVEAFAVAVSNQESLGGSRIVDQKSRLA